MDESAPPVKPTRTGRTGAPSKQGRTSAPAALRQVPVRRIPFTMENPRSMLHRQAWCRKKYGRYLTLTPLCRWGGAYKKETCLWHPFGRRHIQCLCHCHHFPDGPPPFGTRKHPYTIAGQAGTALKGPKEIAHRNRIPGRLLRHLLTYSKQTGWVLDLCSGYQTNRKVVEGAELRYVAVDIERTFRLGSGPHAATATADIVADLTQVDPEDLLDTIEAELGLKVKDLAFIWFSPPCETNADMQHVNKKRDGVLGPVRWHRNPQTGKARDGEEGDLARKHDALVERWADWLIKQWGSLAPGEGVNDPTPTTDMPDSHLEFEPTYDQDDPDKLSAYQPWPEVTGSPLTARRQGSAGKNSQTARYVPSDEKKDQVAAPKRKPKTDDLSDSTRHRPGTGPQPVPRKGPPPKPQAPISAPYAIAELATSYGQAGKQKYAPAKPFQSRETRS